MNESTVVYQTNNLELAATLNYLGYDIISISSGGPSKKSKFLFNNSLEIQTLAESVWNRTAASDYKIEPLDLFAVRSVLLQRLKEER